MHNRGIVPRRGKKPIAPQGQLAAFDEEAHRFQQLMKEKRIEAKQKGRKARSKKT